MRVIVVALLARVSPYRAIPYRAVLTCAAVCAAMFFTADEVQAQTAQSIFTIKLTVSITVPDERGGSRVERANVTTKSLLEVIKDSLAIDAPGGKLVVRRNLASEDLGAARTFLLVGSQEYLLEEGAVPTEGETLNLPQSFFATATSASVGKLGVSDRRISQMIAIHFGDLQADGLEATLIGVERVTAKRKSGLGLLLKEDSVQVVGGMTFASLPAFPAAGANVPGVVQGNYETGAESVPGLD